jgi:glycosyltransferase involved in cell wall biosynthesis
LRLLLLTDEPWVSPVRDGSEKRGYWPRLWGQDIEGDNWPASKSWWNPFASERVLPRGLDPLRTLNVFLKQRQYAAIIPIFETAGVGPLLLKRLGLLRRPLILWDFGAGTEWKMRKLFQKWLFPNVDGVLCISESQRRVAEELGAKGKVVIVGYNIDTNFFSPAPVDEGEFILAVGRDVSRDYDTLLRAVHSYPIDLEIRTRNDLRLHEGSLARVSVEDRWTTYEELRERYRRAKFVVLPLKSVAHPGGITSLAEAMSMGKALICSDSYGLAEFLRPGENAIVVPVGDHEAMLSAIRLLDNDADLRRKLGAGARKFAEENLSNEGFGVKMRQALGRFIHQ